MGLSPLPENNKGGFEYFPSLQMNFFYHSISFEIKRIFISFNKEILTTKSAKHTKMNCI